MVFVAPTPPAAVEEVRVFPGDLGYIRLNGLFKSAGAEMVATLLDMIERELAGVVIDLRGADGRDVDSAVDIASMMASPRSTLFSFRDAEDRDIEVYLAKTEKPLDMPVMILVDEQTTGAAELLVNKRKVALRLNKEAWIRSHGAKEQ